MRQRLLWRGVEIAAFTVLKVPSSVLLLQGLPNAGVKSKREWGQAAAARRVQGELRAAARERVAGTLDDGMWRK